MLYPLSYPRSEARSLGGKAGRQERRIPDEIKADFTGDLQPSVVRHSVADLSRVALARFTFSKMSVAFAVQMKGLGCQ
jgi:hypothetical protein